MNLDVLVETAVTVLNNDINKKNHKMNDIRRDKDVIKDINDIVITPPINCSHSVFKSFMKESKLSIDNINDNTQLSQLSLKIAMSQLKFKAVKIFIYINSY